MQAGESSLNCYSIAYKEKYGSTEQCTDDARFAEIVAGHFGAKCPSLMRLALIPSTI
jgi:hypothetical protein